MRQIFCKLPNPFPYLNYITKFFFGRKSYRQRVFQGPLTLGLQSPSLRASSFRLACGNPSIPARSHITALNRAPVTFASFCPCRLQPTFALRGCSRRFFLLGYPRAVLLPRKPRTCCFASFCLRRLQPTFAFRGCSRRFSCSGTRAQSYHRAKPRSCCFASFCPRRLQPTFATRLHQR